MNISNEKIIYCKNVDGLFLYPGRKNGFTQKESVKNTNSYSEIYDTMKQAKCRNTNEIIFDMFQNADILEKEEAMKIEKKIMDHPVRVWAVCHLFFRLDFQPEYHQGKIVLG